MMSELLRSGVWLVGQDSGGSSFWSMFVFLLPIVPLFYFMIILPQQQQEKKRRAMIDALKKNDKVVTAGGIYGTVVSVDLAGDKLVLRIDDDKNVKLTTTRSSIVRVLDSGSEKGTDGS